MVDWLVEFFAKHKMCEAGREFIDSMVEVASQGEVG